MWADEWPDLITVDLPDAVRQHLLRHRADVAPTPDDYWQAVRAEVGREGQGHGEPFAIPPGLHYRSGDYAHQGRAVDAWEANGGRGILEMATGAGKTKAALIAAQRLWRREGRLLLVVAVPVRPLLEQWAAETRTFGLLPIVPSEKGARGKLAATEAAVRRLAVGASTVECLVVTHDLLCDDQFQGVLGQYRGPALLVADEVHNLGRSGFTERPPQQFDYRLGLSATPIRQYDEAGSELLLEYFGGIVFRFTLADAIRRCLVPYDYYVRPVHLTDDDLARWFRITEKLKRRGWTGEGREKPDLQINILLNQRRDILEGAQEKLSALGDDLRGLHRRTLRHTLIYASDKGPEQLRQVNALLRDLGIRFHQITAQESGHAHLAADLLQAFRRGDLQVLTAKRVLDEGLDIPEVDRVYILASTTVERQWVQRRGRVLRKCPATGKQFATIVDYLVLPPEGHGPDPAARSIVRGELQRISAFARLARNAARPDGPLAAIHPIALEYLA